MAYRPHRYSEERGWTRYSFVDSLKRWEGKPPHFVPPDPGDGAYAIELIRQLHCAPKTFDKARKLAGIRKRRRIPGKPYFEPFTASECKRIIAAFYVARDRKVIKARRPAKATEPPHE